MYVKELAYQGIAGSREGSRLELDEGLCEPKLEAPLTAQTLQSLLASIFYPADALQAGWLDLKAGEGACRVGATLEIGGKEHKLIHDFRAGTVQLLGGKSGTRLLADDPKKIQNTFRKHLGLLPWTSFPVVHLHRFAIGGKDEYPDPEIAKLVREYRRALAVERVENQIADVEAELQDLEKVKSPAVKLEVALDKIRRRLKTLDKLPELQEHELKFLSEYDTRRVERREELDEVLTSLEHNERRAREMEPALLSRNPLPWLGLALGVAAVVAGVWLSANVDPYMRLVSLGNIFGFGIAAVTTVRWLGAKERYLGVRSHSQQLEKRREELEKQTEREAQRLQRLLDKYSASSAQQITEDLGQRDKLRDKHDALQERLKDYESDPDLIGRRNQLRTIRNRLDTLKKARSRLGDFVLPTYELQGDLEKRGVDVTGLRPIDDRPEHELLEVARKYRMIGADTNLSGSQMTALNRLIPPLLGNRDAQLSLEDGELRLALKGSTATGNPLRELSAGDQRLTLTAMALAIALHGKNERERNEKEFMGVLALDNPWTGLNKKERVRLYALIKELGNDLQIIVPSVR